MVAKAVSPDERVAFIDQTVGRMETFMGRNYATEKRTFGEVKSAKRELEDKSLKVVQTDRSGKFTVLPRSIFQRKAKESLDFLFCEWTGNIGKVRKMLSGLFREDEFESMARNLMKCKTVNVEFEVLFERSQAGVAFPHCH